MVKTKSYNYTYSGKLPTFQYAAEKKLQNIEFKGVSYSHYNDWLQKKELYLEASQLTNTNKLQLTNKHLIMQYPNKHLAFPLHTVRRVRVAFRRLLLPLISGGISTPLFAVALWNQLINFWFGIGIVMAGLSLLYYGWLGTHQVSIDFAQNTFNYFTDHKNPDLEKLIDHTNQIIKERDEIIA
jgi:hypothetical protein